MRLRNIAGLVMAAAVVLGTGLPVLSAAAAESATTLYVNNMDVRGCSDTAVGAGTQALPFCTIQAAADAVQPGQTVVIAEADYATGPVHLHTSGTPEKPIVFTKGPQSHYTPWNRDVVLLNVEADDSDPAPGVTLDNVHDVTFDQIGVVARGTAVAVKNSSRVTLSRVYVSATDKPVGRAAIAVTGPAENVVVQQSRISTASGAAISLGAGVKDSRVSGNVVQNAAGAGIAIEDSTGAQIINNTVRNACGNSIALNGASTGATVKNNIAFGVKSGTDMAACPAGADPVEVAVSAAADSGLTYDHNIVYPSAGITPYSFSGIKYATAEALQGTGRGTADLIADPQLDYQLIPKVGSPAVDSADDTVPGPVVDETGLPVADNPGVPNTPSARDRGADELQALTYVALTDSSNGTARATVTLTAAPITNWATNLSYTFDFGDTSAPVVTSSPSVEHLYDACDCWATVTVTDTQNGRQVSNRREVEVGTAQPVDARLNITPQAGNSGSPLFTYRIDTSASKSYTGQIVSRTVDFGDGTTGTPGPDGVVLHTYDSPGKRTVKLTVENDHFVTGTASADVDVNYRPGGFVPVTPVRVLDTRSGVGIAGKLKNDSVAVLKIGRIPAGTTAVVLNVTAVGPSSGSFLTVWPTGQPRGATSNLNFAAGETIPNLVTVPVNADGSVSFYNKSGEVDVVADLFGYYRPEDGNGFSSIAPGRLLDTRKDGGSKLGPDGSVGVLVRGRFGIPADATTAVLNLTATAPDSAGYLTAYPSGTTRPTTSNVNFTANETIPNQVIVPIGADGKVTIFNRYGNTHVVVDVFGYYSPSAPNVFIPTLPRRFLDTRSGAGTKLGADAAVYTQTRVPSAATAVVTNITVTEPTTNSYLTVYARNAVRPGTSNLNFGARQTIANHVISPVSDREVYIYNFAGSTHVIGDVMGYFVTK